MTVSEEADAYLRQPHIAVVPYPSKRAIICHACGQHLGPTAVCPVCGYEDVDKLEDRAIVASRLGPPVDGEELHRIPVIFHYVKFLREHKGLYPH